MIVTTTSTLQNRPVSEYLGLVSGEAKEIAVREMEEAAGRLGADAVIGVDLDYENIQAGSSGGMLMVSASGTAVKLA